MVQDEGSFPLLVQDWGAIEEVLLLDAVEQDGFGNWWVFQLWLDYVYVYVIFMTVISP